MKQIPLRNRAGETVAHALVDDEDFEWLSRWRWHRARRTARHQFHAARSEHVGWDNAARKQTVRSVSMHRQIMGFPSVGIDHEDGDPLNNQRSNLRLATQAQNGQNYTRRKATTSGVRGVTRAPPNRWQARVTLGGFSHHLGYHETIEEAAQAASAFRAEHMPYSEDARHGP